MDSLVIVDRLSRPNVYFSMYFSRNSGFSGYSGQFATDGRIHYYERRLYINISVVNSILGGAEPPPRVAPRGIKLVQLCNSWPEKIIKSSMFTYLPATLPQTVYRMKYSGKLSISRSKMGGS